MQWFQAVVAAAFAYLVVPYVLKQDEYIKHLRKMLTLFPKEVVCGVHTLKDEVLRFVAESAKL